MEEEQELTIDQQDILEVVRYIRIFRWCSTITGIVAFLVMFTAVVISVFSLWVKLALVSLLFVVLCYLFICLEKYVARNNVARSSDTWI